MKQQSRNPFLSVVTQTCGRCRCSSWCCGWWNRRCSRCGGGSLFIVDAGGCALGSFPSLASLVRSEQHVEGAPAHCHVRRVILTELFFSNLDKVAAFVAVGVLGGEGECRAGEVQLAFAPLSSLELDDTLDILAICVGLLG